MMAVSLFDILAGNGREAQCDGRQPAGRLALLAEKLVASSLADFERIKEYEQQFALAGQNDPRIELLVLRSIWQLFAQWVGEAEQVLTRARSLPPLSANSVGISRLNDAIGQIQARLSLTPEQIANAKQQERQGQFVPAKEVRDELHARLRA